MERTKFLKLEQDLSKGLTKGGYLKIDRRMPPILGPIASILLGTYIDKYEYLKKKRLIYNGWFFMTHQQLTIKINLKIGSIRKYKSYLVKLKILETKMKGVPAKEWFRIDFIVLNQILKTGVPIQQLTELPEPTSLINETKDKRIQLYDETSLNTSLSNSDFPIVPNLFETFWKLYPKKPDKGKALTTWNKICKKSTKERPTWKQLRKALKLQKQSERWQDIKFIPHPTTWLNQSRWLDDPEEMKSFNRETDNKPDYKMEYGKKFFLDKDGKYYDRKGNLYE